MLRALCPVPSLSPLCVSQSNSLFFHSSSSIDHCCFRETIVVNMMKKTLGLLLRSTVASRPSWSTSSVPAASCVSALSPEAAQTRHFSAGFVAAISQNVGFIGLGNMGSHMASNLLKAGHSLCVFDKNEDVMQAFAAKGASVAKTPLEVAEESDVVITMLPAAAHMSCVVGACSHLTIAARYNPDDDKFPFAERFTVQAVYTGSNGLLTKSGALRPSLFIDCSTIDPQTCRLLASKIDQCTLTSSSREAGSLTAFMLDAPVSGGVGGAQAGTLTFMVGGPKEGLTEALPLLNAMGKRVVHCGGPGNGAVAKVCNNLAMGISMAGVSEGYALGQRLGVDAVTLSKIFNSSSARCWSSDTYNPVPGVMDGVPASRNYQGGFSCHLLAKDLGLAVTAAEEAGMAVPLTEQVHEMYSTLCKSGHGHEDFSSIFCFQYHGEPQPLLSEANSDPLIAQT